MHLHLVHLPQTLASSLWAMMLLDHCINHVAQLTNCQLRYSVLEQISVPADPWYALHVALEFPNLVVVLTSCEGQEGR